MNVQILSAVMQTQFDNPKYKLMLAQMAHEADEEGVCRSTIGNISKQCNLNLGNTFKCIQELEQADYLTIDNSDRRGLAFVLNSANIAKTKVRH